VNGEPEPDDLHKLAVELSELRDLFQRRLLEDKAKQRLFDELYAQVEFARQGLISQALEPLLREELLMIDRLDQYQGSDMEFVITVRVELMEILSRRGVTEIAVEGPFDPSQHEAVESITSNKKRVGQIIGVRRPGYFIANRLLRPAQVTVGVQDNENLAIDGIEEF
jgi:molecular chaperone GrpE